MGFCLLRIRPPELISTGENRFLVISVTAFRGRLLEIVDTMVRNFQRLLRLREQIHQLAASRPKICALHLSASGNPTDPDTASREKAILMQLRLHLEAQLDPRISR